MCMWAIVVHVAVLTISEQRAVGIMGFRNIAMEPSHTTLSVPHKSPPPPAVCVCVCVWVCAWVMLCCVCVGLTLGPDILRVCLSWGSLLFPTPCWVDHRVYVCRCACVRACVRACVCAHAH